MDGELFNITIQIILSILCGTGKQHNTEKINVIFWLCVGKIKRTKIKRKAMGSTSFSHLWWRPGPSSPALPPQTGPPQQCGWTHRSSPTLPSAPDLCRCFLWTTRKWRGQSGTEGLEHLQVRQPWSGIRSTPESRASGYQHDITCGNISMLWNFASCTGLLKQLSKITLSLLYVCT